MGIEPALQIVELPEHIVSTPSAAGGVVVRAFPIILPRLGRTPVSFGLGFAIGLVLSHAITQRPVVEKIVSPDILVLVTPPMLAPVPLLILRFGLGTTPSMIVAALAVGSMVTINSATESWRTDGVRIARARACRASTPGAPGRRAPMASPWTAAGSPSRPGWASSTGPRPPTPWWRGRATWRTKSSTTSSRHLRGWAMGLEFAHHNPQAAVRALFDVIAQVDGATPGVAEEVVTSDLLLEANDFDAAQARAEAAEELTAVDTAALRATMFDQAT